jgi:hypothetical protein
MKLFLTSLILIIQFQFLTAQVLSDGEPIPSKESVERFIGSDDSGFYVLRYGRAGMGMQIYIEKYEIRTYKLIFSTKIDNEKVQKDLHLKPGAYFYLQARTFYINNLVHVFFEIFDKDGGKQMLLMQKVDSAGMLSDVFIVEVQKAEKEHQIYFTVHYTNDKKMFYVQSRENKNNFFTGTSVPVISQALWDKYSYNSNISLFNSLTYEKIREHALGDKYVGEVVVDNAGILYFSEWRKEIPANVLRIGIIETSSPVIKTLEFKMQPGKKIIDYSLQTFENGNTCVYGMVSDSSGPINKSIDPAVFFNLINGHDLVISNKAYIELDPITKEKLVQNNPSFKESFGFMNLFRIGEDFYFTCESQLTPVNTTMGNPINHRDFIVLKIDKDYNKKWIRPISKNIKGGWPELAEREKFNYGIVNNEISFFYIEDVSNEKLSPETPSSSYQPLGKYNGPSNAVYAHVDKDGNVKKDIFYKNPGGKLIFNPLRELIFPEPGKVLIYLENKKLNLERFATLNLNTK